MNARHAQISLRRLALPLLAALLLVLAAPAAASAASLWGPLSAATLLTAGTGPGQIDAESQNIAFAVDPGNRSFFVAEPVDESEGKFRTFRIQRFNAAGTFEKAVTVTTPEQGATSTKTLPSEVQLAYDATKNRVYALMVYERKTERKSGGSAQDAGVTAAGSLYGFTGELGPLKVSKGEAAPILGEAQLKDQSETPREALLDPHGVAAEAGDLYITGDIDGKSFKAEGEKECRGVAQQVTISEAGEAQLGPRYVDEKRQLHALHCGETKQEGLNSPQSAPSSPVLTASGKLLVFESGGIERTLGCTEENEEIEQANEARAKKHEKLEEPVACPEDAAAEVWELAPTSEKIGTTGTIEEFALAARSLYALPHEEDEETLQEVLELPEESAPAMMSYASEGPTGGKLYLQAELEGPEGSNTGVLALQLSEPHGIELQELGFTAGARELGSSSQGCVIPQPRDNAGVRLGGFKEGSKEGVLAFNLFLAEREYHPELLLFGPGGKAEECPHTTLTVPEVKVGSSEVTTVRPDENVTLVSRLEGALVKSVEWKLENETTHEKPETHPGANSKEKVEREVISGFPVSTEVSLLQTAQLEHTFTTEGKYKITETVQTDDLAEPEIKSERTLVVGSTPPELTFTFHSPKVEVGQEAIFEARVQDENPSPAPLEYVWEFGDGAEQKGEIKKLESGETTLIAKHTYSASCASCKVTLKVTDHEKHVGEVSVPIEVRAKPGGGTTSTETTPTNTTTTGSTQTATTSSTPQGEVKGYTVVHDPEVRLVGGTLSVTPAGALSVKLTCPTLEESCTGTITLRTLTAVSSSGRKHKKAIMTLASGGFVIAGGQAKVLALHLSAAARALLSHSHVLRVAASMAAKDPAGVSKTTQATVTLRLVTPVSHKHKHR